MAKGNWERSVRQLKRQISAEREWRARRRGKAVKAKPRAGAAITPALLGLMRRHGVPAAELEQYER